MHIPLTLRLTLLYTLVLGIALGIFGSIVYTQAEQRAYSELDMTLRSRAASVRLGKDIFVASTGSTDTLPKLLNSVDTVGAGGVAIEIFTIDNDGKLHLLATTDSSKDNPVQSSVVDMVPTRVPWDASAINSIRRTGSTDGIYSTVVFLQQHIRVYTTTNNDLGQLFIIQTARTQQDIEQSLSSLRLVLLSGASLVLLFALVGGWLISRGVLAAVHSMTNTAREISVSHDFSKRVPAKNTWGRDELVILADTLNQMLTGLEGVYQRQQRFIADASHELRAPITSIQCNLDLLVKAADLPADEVAAALIDARTETARMGRLVSDLLLLARNDSLTQTKHPDTTSLNGYKKYLIDLDTLVLEVFRQYQPMPTTDISDAQNGPRLVLQHIVPVQIEGNPDQLKQILVALVDNACKYTPEEGCVTLSLMVEDEQALVTVSDTGIGVTPEDLPHIFERFYRADRARSRDKGGSGLGLAIVQSIVQEHHGTIHVESTLGKGAVFKVKLPTIHHKQ